MLTNDLPPPQNRPMKNLFRLLPIIFLTVIFSQTSTYLPYQRSNIDIRYLQSSGLINQIDISQLPLTNKDLFQNSSKFPKFLYHLQLPKSKNAHNAKFSAYPIMVYDGDSFIHLRSKVEINLGKNLTIQNTMLLDKSLKDQSEYIGEHWRGYVGYAEEAFIKYLNKKKIDYIFKFGRFFSYWGPGRTGQLLLSSASRPLDGVQAILKYKNVSFAWKASKLDAISGKNRYLSSHRVTYKNKKFRISLNETVLYGGASRNFELAYVNPFIIYTGEQQNGPELKANTMLSIDGRYQFSKKSIYFEFLIDDYQVDADVVNDLEPNELGLILGADFSFKKLYLGAELVGITNRTYKTSQDYEWYLHRNIPIGYGEGSDLWRANIFSRYYFSQDWQFDFEIDFLVKGEGEMSYPWDTPWTDDGITMETGYDEPFPTGIPERQFEASVGIFRLFDSNKWISVELKYITIDNIDHISNTINDDIEVSIGLSWIFTKEFNLD